MMVVVVLTAVVIVEVVIRSNLMAKIWYSPFPDLFRFFFIIPEYFEIPEFCHPEPRPTTLRSYLTYYVKQT